MSTISSSFRESLCTSTLISRTSYSKTSAQVTQSGSSYTSTFVLFRSPRTTLRESITGRKPLRSEQNSRTTVSLDDRIGLQLTGESFRSDEAFLRVSYLLRLYPANALDLDTLRAHLERCRTKNPVFLRGFESETWDEHHEGDLTSLTDRYHNKDVLSKLIDKHCIPWYDKVRGSKVRNPVSLAEAWVGQEKPDIRLWNYSDTTVSLVVSTIGTALAPLLPMAAILGLFFVEKQLTKILLTMLFTLLFSLALTLLTRHRPIDKFIATAAFAAVLVVFVQPNDCRIVKQ